MFSTASNTSVDVKLKECSMKKDMSLKKVCMNERRLQEVFHIAHCKQKMSRETYSTLNNIFKESSYYNNSDIDDIEVEIIAMHYGIGWGKDKEYSHKNDGKSCGNTLCLSPHPIP